MKRDDALIHDIPGGTSMARINLGNMVFNERSQTQKATTCEI